MGAGQCCAARECVAVRAGRLCTFKIAGDRQSRSRGAEVGMVGVNDLSIAAKIPFGGIKESGTGREGGRLGILDYLEPKFIKMRFA
jgi:acyl-CoA reductase-like NAD-dependent aldehyde dehydrogenase